MLNSKNTPPIYHGTTTVGLIASDQVVLTTDTRVTSGYLFIAHRNGKKVHKISDNIAMTIAGGVADAQNIIDILKYHTSMYQLEKNELMPIKSAARLVSNVFTSARLFPYIAEVLVAGVDKSGPRLFDVDLFGSLSEEKYVSTGSGSPVAYGVLESEYKEGLSVDDGIKIGVKAVTAAMKRNAGTGDNFDVATIGKDGYKELSAPEKDRVLESISRT